MAGRQCHKGEYLQKHVRGHPQSTLGTNIFQIAKSTGSYVSRQVIAMYRRFKTLYHPYFPKVLCR